MNWANQITLMRLLLIPFVLWAISQNLWLWAVLGFAVAGLSDALDGFLARKYFGISKLGAFLDPLADKLLMVSVGLNLFYLGLLPLWFVVILVVRDFLIVLGVLLSWLVQRPIEISPLMVSKLTTIFQILLLGTLLFLKAFAISHDVIPNVLLSVAGGLTFVSLMAYCWVWMRHIFAYRWS